MRVIMFQERFAEAVREGRKISTIRKSCRCKPGDELSLRCWEGKPYRSKQVELRRVVCRDVRRLRIEEGKGFLYWRVLIGDGEDAIELDVMERWRLAEIEGFGGMPDMLLWFAMNGGVPFDGFRILWE